eukprot:scaffold422069_cov51-Attheya_sp.AAC.1
MLFRQIKPWRHHHHHHHSLDGTTSRNGGVTRDHRTRSNPVHPSQDGERIEEGLAILPRPPKM